MVVRSVGAEKRSLPVLANVLIFGPLGVYLLTYMFYIPSLEVVRSVGADIRSLPVMVAILIFGHLSVYLLT